MSTCRSDVYCGQAHTCDDPAGCSVAQLVAGPDPRDEELEHLHELLDWIEDVCDTSTAKWAKTTLNKIHTERGGSAT